MPAAREKKSHNLLRFVWNEHIFMAMHQSFAGCCCEGKRRIRGDLPESPLEREKTLGLRA